MICSGCKQPLGPEARITAPNGQVWIEGHTKEQCLQASRQAAQDRSGQAFSIPVVSGYGETASGELVASNAKWGGK